MRTIIVAVLFGLFLIPTAVMAAPSNPCTVTLSKAGRPILKGCSTKQRNQFLTALDKATSKPTTKVVDKVLRKRMGKFFLTIRTVCFPKQKATRKSVSRKAIEKCADYLDFSPRAVVLYAHNNIKAIKKCIGIKKFKKQLLCMIDSPNSGELSDIIEAALDLRDAYREGLKTLWKFGCDLEKGQLKCASSAGLVLAALFMFLLGRLRPQLRITIGVVAMVIGVVYVNTADAACTNVKLLPALTKLSKDINLSDEEVSVKMPRVVSTIVAKCKLEKSQDLAFLEAQKKQFMQAYDILAGPSAAMVNYCTTLRGTENINNCFKRQRQAEKDLNILVHKAQKLYWDRYDEIRKQKRAAKKADKDKASKKLLDEGEKQLQESKEVLDALKELNSIVVQEGSCGGFFMVLLYGLLGLLGGCRSKFLVILVTLGCMSSLADAAAKGGCSVDSDENIIELFEGSCSPEVLQSLIEEEGLICTQEHRMEGASLSMAAPQGLSKEADLRHRFLEALCWNKAGFGWVALLMGLFRRRRRIGQGPVGLAALIPDPDNYEEIVGCDIKRNQTVEIEKDIFEFDCVVITISMVVHNKNSQTDQRLTIVKNKKSRWVRKGFSGYFTEQVFNNPEVLKEWEKYIKIA